MIMISVRINKIQSSIPHRHRCSVSVGHAWVFLLFYRCYLKSPCCTLEYILDFWNLSAAMNIWVKGTEFYPYSLFTSWKVPSSSCLWLSGPPWVMGDPLHMHQCRNHSLVAEHFVWVEWWRWQGRRRYQPWSVAVLKKQVIVVQLVNIMRPTMKYFCGCTLKREMSLQQSRRIRRMRSQISVLLH